MPILGTNPKYTYFNEIRMINPWEFEKSLPPAPLNYIPGLGRGAHGFTTGGDITGITPGKRNNDEMDNSDYSDHKFDTWSGFNDSHLFTSQSDKEDHEADQIWNEIDKKLEARPGKKVKTEIVQQDIKSKIHTQFSDVKKGLEKVTAEEWMNIPEIGDYTIKKAKWDTYTPVPDSLFMKAQQEHEKNVSIDSRDGNQTSIVDPNQLSGVKEMIFKTKLKKFEDRVSGVSSVNPQTYINDMDSRTNFSETEMGDLKKIRLLFKTLTQSNPHHGPAWITAAKIEEGSGKIAEARKILGQALEFCSDQEEVWLEAVRLAAPNDAKVLIAQAVEAIRDSVHLWLQAASLEMEKKNKKKVLRKALESIPNSVQLWKEAISLEDSEDNARILLGRAVECIPQNSDLWLALARLETYENARKVLNKARQSIPSDPQIWIAACELEEENGANNSDAIIQKAIKSLQAQHVLIDRDQWIKYAEKCEDGKHFQTCQSIIKATIGNDIDEAERQYKWLEDAEKCLQTGHIKTASVICSHALSEFKMNEQIWIMAAKIESPRDEINILIKGLEFCSESVHLWMLVIEKARKLGDLSLCREILEKAFEKRPDVEGIWLHACSIETESGHVEKARNLLTLAREKCPTPRIWMKSALFERNQGDFKAEKRFIDAALDLFKDFPKLWIMSARWEELHGNAKNAQQIYLTGIRNCQESVPLWKCCISLEEKLGNPTRTRALIEKARQKIPKNDDIWLMSIRFESMSGMNETASSYLANALQECPSSGKLWAESIIMETRPKQNARAALALEKCGKNAHVMTTIARMFWRDRAFEKAKTWFYRAINQDKDYGDAYSYLYNFLQEHGKEEISKVENLCIEANPKHGELWGNFSKDHRYHDKKTFDILRLSSVKADMLKS